MKTEIIFQDKYFYSKNAARPSLKYRRQIMSIFLAISDALSIAMSMLVAIFLWSQVRTDLQLEAHFRIIPPAIIFFILIFELMALYPAIGIGPVEELKRLTVSASFLTFVFATLSFFLRTTTVFSRATLTIAWLLILISVPMSRKIFRRIAVKYGFWGIPIAIVGDQKSVIHLQDRLSLHPISGLWPVLCVTGSVEDIFPKTKNRKNLFENIHTVFIATAQGKFNSARYLVTQKEYQFNNIIIIFDKESFGPIWFKPIFLVEHTGLEVVHNLLSSTQQTIKRVMDISLTILALPIFIFLFFIIGLIIKIDDRGPIFYKHKRVGYEGKDLWIWKFRTMAYNADVMLEEHIKNNPKIHQEWKENFKLKNDPRLTRIGKLLRRTSLDEVPQIINVLKGEMSLIGPRPIVQQEIPLYGSEFEIYKQVLPGITGLWQISGRSNLSYKDRVALDGYYIQNWSIWLDIHVLIHTALATIQGRGAY